MMELAMKRGCWMILLSCLAIGFSGCMPGLSETPKSTVSVEGDYRISFPKATKRDVKQLPSPAGNLNHVMVSCETKDGTFYAVSVTDFPTETIGEQNTDDILDGSVQGMQTSATWTNVVEKRIKLAAHHGRDLSANLTSTQFKGVGTARTRVYFIGSKLYQLLIIAPESKNDAKKFDAFLDSFELLKDVPDVTKTSDDPLKETPPTQ